MSKKLVLRDPEILDKIVHLADEVLDAREDEDKVIEAIARFVDGALPFDVIIPGDAGDFIEKVDGPAIEFGLEKLVEAIKKLFRKDPAKVAARKARRAARKKAKAEAKAKD